MTFIFYALCIFPIWLEVLNIYDTETILRLSKIAKDRNKVEGKIDISTLSDEYKTIVLLNMFYMIWVFFGLFTFQWLSFLTLMILGFIPSSNKYTKRIDGVFSLIILIFIILNAYHFEISSLDTIKYLRGIE